MVLKVTQSPSGLLLLTSFLLHMEEGRASPTRLVCDNRLIQKYIGEAKDMEKRVVRIQSPQSPRPGMGTAPGMSPQVMSCPPQGQCQVLPALSCPAVLPLVDFSLQQWKSKSVRGAGKTVLALGCSHG